MEPRLWTKRGTFSSSLFTFCFHLGNKRCHIYLPRSRKEHPSPISQFPRQLQTDLFELFPQRAAQGTSVSFLGRDLEAAAQKSPCRGPCRQFLHLELQNEAPHQRSKIPRPNLECPILVPSPSVGKFFGLPHTQKETAREKRPFPVTQPWGAVTPCPMCSNAQVPAPAGPPIHRGPHESCWVDAYPDSCLLLPPCGGSTAPQRLRTGPETPGPWATRSAESPGGRPLRSAVPFIMSPKLLRPSFSKYNTACV